MFNNNEDIFVDHESFHHLRTAMICQSFAKIWGGFVNYQCLNWFIFPVNGMVLHQ